MASRHAVLLTRHPTKGVCPERPSGVRDLSSPPGSVHPTQLPSYQQIALICLKQHPFPSITYKRPICNPFVFNSIQTAPGGVPPFLIPSIYYPPPTTHSPSSPIAGKRPWCNNEPRREKSSRSGETTPLSPVSKDSERTSGPASATRRPRLEFDPDSVGIATASRAWVHRSNGGAESTG